jgi:hypothetical protein
MLRFVLAILIWLVMGLSAQATYAAEDFNALYNELLQAYWRPTISIHGVETTVFDYARMSEDAQKSDSLFKRTLRALESSRPASLPDATAKAFWINAYNFGAMRLIVDHYPVDSIRSLKISLIKYPWSKEVIHIDSRDYSLTEIEKDILLKQYGDPRIIFAVSCAAVSCPDRTPSAFTGSHLDEQLDEMIRVFLTNPHKGMSLNREQRILTLSWILKKDAYLFPQEKGGVLEFIQPYLEPETRQWLQANPVEIRYFEHDWTLNDLAQAESTQTDS